MLITSLFLEKRRKKVGKSFTTFLMALTPEFWDVRAVISKLNIAVNTQKMFQEIILKQI